jgi:hypothetical protein
VATADFDDDGWFDIYVACDSTPSIVALSITTIKTEPSLTWPESQELRST